MRWQNGTGTLLGAMLGALVGFLLSQVPLFVAIGLASGVGVDSWIHRPNQEEL